MPEEYDATTGTIADFLTEEGMRASLEVEQPAVIRDGWWQGEGTLRDWRGGPPIPVAVSSFLVTDLETGPNGHLYAVSTNRGAIYEVTPAG